MTKFRISETYAMLEKRDALNSCVNCKWCIRGYSFRCTNPKVLETHECEKYLNWEAREND
jgi:hypothetical protein